jgi:hypothetical protein
MEKIKEEMRTVCLIQEDLSKITGSESCMWAMATKFVKRSGSTN